MTTIDIINGILKDCSINFFTYLVFMKLINYKSNNRIRNTIIIAFISLLLAVLCFLANMYFSGFIAVSMVAIVYGILFSKIIKCRIQYSIIVASISLAITYLIYAISVLIVGGLLSVIRNNVQKNSIIVLVLIIIAETLLIHRILKIKRLRGGAVFLQDKDRLNDIGIKGFLLIGITMLLYSLVGNTKEIKINEYLIFATIILAISVTLWVKKKITKFYKQKLKENTIQELENEIKQKDEEISKILEENKTIATINHKYSSRITALEKFSAKILAKPEIISKMKTEFGEDFTEFEKQIKTLSEEYKNEIKENVKLQNKIPKTWIFGIDNILEHLREEAAKENIEFDLKLNGSINYMVENVIDQSKLETLLGDHIKDAIIAIRHSDNNYRKILAILGIVDACYEVCIYDTGIEFEIDTLLKLGTEAVTTHKKTGGSGIGFMTTFETMNKTNASLIIEENHKMNNTDFTKAVKIRFDGKNEYKIKSYRAEEIMDKNKREELIVE